MLLHEDQYKQLIYTVRIGITGVNAAQKNLRIPNCPSSLLLFFSHFPLPSSSILLRMLSLFTATIDKAFARYGLKGGRANGVIAFSR